MAFVYIRYSEELDRFYIGSCLDLDSRIREHLEKRYLGFTSNASDWKLFLSLPNLEYKRARNIENHIKVMKSKKYVESLKKYPELGNKLIQQYNTGALGFDIIDL